MSNIINYALEKVQKSEFIFDSENDPKLLEVRDAMLLFTNFAGQANRFGNTSKNFNIVISDALVNKMYVGNDNKGNAMYKLGDLNVNVHQYSKESDEGMNTVYYINVKVNMQSQWPPLVQLFTNANGVKSKKSLDDDTIGCLDRADIVRSDVKVNIRESHARPGWAVFYLRQLNAIQNKIPDFGGIYDEWDDPLEPNEEIVENNKELLEN